MKQSKEYTISLEALCDLDNARIELYHLAEEFEGIIKRDTLRPIRQAIKAIDVVVALMNKDEVAHENKICKAAAKLHTDDSPAVYSCNTDPKEIVHHGVIVFERNDVGGRRIIVEQCVSPTYEMAFKAFQKSIKLTGDEHHVFFEGVMFLGILHGKMHYELVSGS